MSLSPRNSQNLQDIESAILLVCLDGSAPVDEDARAWSYWSGGLSAEPKGHGWNRWFDKHEVIVDESGESGFNGEREWLPHPTLRAADSMLDGTPTLRLNEFMLASIANGKIPLELAEGEKATSSMPEPMELVFELDRKATEAVERSRQGFNEEMAQQQLKVSYSQNSR